MTRRERQQRWLVNQKFARWVVSLLKVKNRQGIMCLIAWGLWFFNFSRTDWKQTCGREVALWLSMPAIILALFFESELGNFFEQSYDRQNRPGPFHSRSRFRMMEVHDQFWGFDMAWWNASVDDPGRCMPNTMKYLEENFEGDELDMRRSQIIHGLTMGRDEMFKISKRYLLKPPLIILLLTHRTRGAPFFASCTVRPAQIFEQSA